ncbi:MAG TPA: TlpA disulfide reductase family protein [Usitatibacter sp.]|nr:TlpA disulfide reductase family protein [Usitatibacter sp.]
MAASVIKPWTGKETPPLMRPDLSGKVVDLKELRGKVVVLNFWATWCEPCMAEMPSLERLRSRFQGRPLEVLTVNYGEGTPRIRDYLAKQKISLPVLLDPDKEAATAWRAGGLPITFLIDARGRVRHYAFGERDWSDEETVKLVENMLGGGGDARR